MLGWDEKKKKWLLLKVTRITNMENKHHKPATKASSLFSNQTKSFDEDEVFLQTKSYSLGGVPGMERWVS